MAVNKGQVVELEITAIAFGGKGMARLNGLAVFIDQAIPGDDLTSDTEGGGE